MGTGTRTGAYTFEEFCDLIPDGQKADLIDGVIYMASPDNTDAASLFGWLFHLMYGFADEKGLGTVFGLRVAFRLGERNGPEPDIALVRSERAHLIRRGYVDGPPDLAVEIVSPDSVERDYDTKRRQYQEAGVPEYWIVDEMEQKVLLLRLDTRGKYREVRPRKGVLHSQALEGFWIRPEWLWQDRRPRVRQTLQQILAEPG